MCTISKLIIKQYKQKLENSLLSKMVKGKVYKVSNFSSPLFRKCFKVVTVSDLQHYQYLVLPNQQQSLSINNAKNLSLICTDENDRKSYIELEGQCLYKYALKSKNDSTKFFSEKEVWALINSIAIAFIQLKLYDFSKYLTHFREYSVRRIEKEGCKVQYKLLFHKQMVSQSQAAKLGICKWSDFYLSPQQLCDRFIPQKSIVFSFGLMLLHFCSKTLKMGCIYQKDKYELDERQLKKRLKIARESKRYSKSLLNFIQCCLQMDHSKRWNFLELISELQSLARLRIKQFDLNINKEMRDKIEELREKEDQRKNILQFQFHEVDINCESPKILLIKPNKKGHQTNIQFERQKCYSDEPEKHQGYQQTNAKTYKSTKKKPDLERTEKELFDNQDLSYEKGIEEENLQRDQGQEQNLLWNLNGYEYSYQSERILDRRIFGSKGQSPRSNVSYYSQHIPVSQKQDLNKVKKGQVMIGNSLIKDYGCNELEIQMVKGKFIPNFPFRKAQLKLPSLLVQMKKISLSSCLKPVQQIIRNLGKAGIWAQGDIYYGNLWENKRSGLGLEIYSNGQYYYGYFQNDTFHGQGFYYWNNQEFYFGLFQNGQKVEGRLEGPIRYQGQFRNNKRHGVGTCWYELGEVYCGEWFNGKRHGAGFVIDSDGSQFEGNWYEGQRKQVGYLQNDMGRITGHWNRQSIEGECLIQYKNGDYFKGEVNEKLEKKKGVYFKKEGDSYLEVQLKSQKAPRREGSF